MKQQFFLPVKSNGMEIFFGRVASYLKTLIETTPHTELFYLTDHTTALHCLPLIDRELAVDPTHLLSVSTGEESKNITTCVQIWNFLSACKADQDALLIILGGGALSDVGGFSASVYKRGIRFINVPTTLLAQVDASVGFKTAINLGDEKNIVGNFSPPTAVVIDEKFLATLPRSELLSGCAEMIKHGLIKDAAYFNQLNQLLSTTNLHAVPMAMIVRSVEIKNGVVTADPFEKGLRKILNFGHTVGHALESFSLKEGPRLSHGEAVAMGMICELFLSSRYCNFPEEERDTIALFILSLFGKNIIQASTYDRLYTIMLNDKKNRGGRINFSLLTDIGKSITDCYGSKQDILSAFNFYNLLASPF